MTFFKTESQGLKIHSRHLQLYLPALLPRFLYFQTCMSCLCWSCCIQHYSYYKHYSIKAIAYMGLSQGSNSPTPSLLAVDPPRDSPPPAPPPPPPAPLYFTPHDHTHLHYHFQHCQTPPTDARSVSPSHDASPGSRPRPAPPGPLGPPWRSRPPPGRLLLPP